MSNFDFAAFAVTKAAANSRGPSVKDMTAEEARQFVRVVDGNVRKAVEGFKGLTLQLGKRKLDLNALSAGAAKIQVPDDQVEAATAAMLEAVMGGVMDTAIAETIVLLNTAPEKRAAAPAPSDADLEPLPTLEEGDLEALPAE